MNSKDSSKYARFNGQTIVIKISGKVVGDEQALRLTMQQLLALKEAGCRVILIHGGGDQIDSELDDCGLVYHKIDGVRFTSEDALPVVRECLAFLNEEVVRIFEEEAGILGSALAAIGSKQIEASVLIAEEKFDSSRTGQIKSVDAEALRKLVDADAVPIMHSICLGDDGDYYNVNADEVAMAVAESLGANRLIFCSNTCIKDADGAPITELSDQDIDGLVLVGTISGGAVIKVLACKAIVLSGRVGQVVVLNGRDGSLVKELQTTLGAGTHIIKAFASTTSGGKL